MLVVDDDEPIGRVLVGQLIDRHAIRGHVTAWRQCPTASGHDAARGTLGRIEVDVVPSDDGDSVRLEVDLLTKGRLCIRPRGSKSGTKKMHPSSSAAA